MNRRFAATMELQRPSGRGIGAGGDAGYRAPTPPALPPPPETSAVSGVCPHCGGETSVFLVWCDGHTIEVHRCVAHGDVVTEGNNR